MESKLNIDEFLNRDEKKDLLRLLTAGSVDDGKSTLIGRLLFDSKKLYEDQLDALERDSKRVGNAGDNIDYALLLDGLKAEREQGITIDVAYRYFSTNSRKFIIADTPGHEQYTRNMITGGSTANLAIILVDARTGVITQTRRHSYLVSLLGIKHVVLAVNKMDLVDYSESVFNNIVETYSSFVKTLDIPDITPIPLSALKGDNVVENSTNMDWYKGVPLLAFLETIKIDSDFDFTHLRYPVQYVLRPNLDFRGFSGKVAAGVVHKGDEVIALPSMKRSKVSGIHVWEGELTEAFPPQSVTLTLEDEIDISRGEMIVHPANLPTISRNIEATLVWMDEEQMNRDKQFFIKHTTQTTRVRIDKIKYRVDVNTMEHLEPASLTLNEVANIQITTSKPLFFDPYKTNKNTGSFIIIDPISNNTSAVGMIIGEVDNSDLSTPITASAIEKMNSGESIVTKEERTRILGAGACAIAVTGSDRNVFAYTLERRLTDISHCAVVLDASKLSLDENQIIKLSKSLKNQGLTVIYISETMISDDDLIIIDTAKEESINIESIINIING